MSAAVSGVGPALGPSSSSRILDEGFAALAAAGALGEAVAHVPLIESHLVEAPYIGIGFVLLTVAGFFLAVLLTVRPAEPVWAAAGVVAVLALLGYVLSRTVGLPQIGDDVGAWRDPLGIVAVSCEALMVLAALVHVAVRRFRPS